MKSTLYLGTILLALLATSQPASAGASDVAKSAVDGASSIGLKVEHAVKRGLKAGADGIETGAHAAGRTADKVAKKLGLPIGPVASTQHPVDPSTP